MLTLNLREEKRNPWTGTPFTLRGVAIVQPEKDGSFSFPTKPGSYFVTLTKYNEPTGSTYLVPKVLGLPATVTIKAGETTTLNYSVSE